MRQWPVYSPARSPGPEQEKLASSLAEMLAADNALEQLEKVRQAAEPLSNGYAVLYRSTFEKRDKAYETAIDQVKGLPEWLAFSKDTEVTNAERDLVLQPLASRLGGKLDLPNGATVCRNTRATISQMDSDIAAVEGLTRDVIRRLQQFLEPDEKIERFRVSQHISGKISNEEELDAAHENAAGETCQTPRPRLQGHPRMSYARLRPCHQEFRCCRAFAAIA